MERITADKSYLIKDTKTNKNAYFSLMHGLHINNLEVIKSGLKGGAKMSNLWMCPEINDDYLHQEKKSYQLVTALDFAGRNCSLKNFEYVLSTLKPKEEYYFKHICKLIMTQLDDENKIDNNELQKQIEKIIRANFGTQSINKNYAIASLDGLLSSSWQKPTTATLLHVACYHHNTKLVKLLLELGADPNVSIKGDEKYPAHLVIRTTRTTGNQDSGVEILTTLLNYKSNFNLTNKEKESVWEATIHKFKIPELKKIFANHHPTKLSIIDNIKRRSSSLYTFWSQRTNNFKSYPLINDMIQYENRSIQVSKGLSEVKFSESFFKNNSLKIALQKRYKINSSRICNFFNTNLLERSERNGEKIVTIQPDCLFKADFLSLLFLKSATPNTSDFLDLLENKSLALSDLMDELNKTNRYHTHSNFNTLSNELSKILLNNFTPSQIKEILTSKEHNHDEYLEIEDTVAMYKKFPKEYKSLMTNEPFHKLNNLVKIHDFLSAKSEMMEQENFKLEQDKKHPKLTKLKDIKLPEGYGIVLAEENYDLIKWGSSMGHCVGGGDYGINAKNGETIIMAITENNEPKYCVEITPDGRIEQIQGKSRSVPSKPVLMDFINGLKTTGIINKSQTVKEWIN